MRFISYGLYRFLPSGVYLSNWTAFPAKTATGTKPSIAIANKICLLNVMAFSFVSFLTLQLYKNSRSRKSGKLGSWDKEVLPAAACATATREATTEAAKASTTTAKTPTPEPPRWSAVVGDTVFVVFGN